MRWRHVAPRVAAHAVLREWFGTNEQPPTRLALAAHQRSAVERITDMMHRRRGALLADAVGLGKTWVALAVIERALQQGATVTVLVPAALRRHWQQHLRRLPARLRQAPRIVTHTALSFGRVPERQPDIVVIDEAHAFRNPNAHRYEAAQRLCAGARVLLLTATPINNALDDLYHLIRLFAEDHDFADLGVHDLRHTFRSAPTDAHQQRCVQRVLHEVLVLRTREDLATLDAGPRFPQRNAPQHIGYDLAGTYGAAWPALFHALERVAFAFASAPGHEVAGELMRLQLLKRLESSVCAFTISLGRQARLARVLLGALERGLWIAPAALRALVRDGEVGAQLPLEELLAERLPRAADVNAFSAALRQDAELLQSCLVSVRGARQQDDPKLAALIALLRQREPGVLVFTQYRDTAVYLWQKLQRRFRVGLVHGSDARLGARPAARSTVVEAFAPRANGAAAPRAHVRVDVLIATDVLSEGLNLQDAHTVVNYDIPWNPVTLMQRAGRIDRLGSQHEEVSLYNIVPDRGLDALLGLMERVERKLHVIRRALGSTDAVLDLPAPGTARAAFASARPQAGRERLLAAHQPVERLRARWLRETARARGSLPVVCRCAARSAGWLVVVRAGGALRFLCVDSARVREDVQQACAVLEASLDDDSTASCAAAPPWEVVRNWLDAENGLRNSQRARAPETIAARRILESLRGAEAGSHVMDRANLLLKRLARPLPRAAQDRLRSALQAGPAGANADSLVDSLEAALPDATASPRTTRIQPIAAFQLTSASGSAAP